MREANDHCLRWIAQCQMKKTLDLQIAEAIDTRSLAERGEYVLDRTLAICDKFFDDLERPSLDLSGGLADLFKKRKGRRTILAKPKQSFAIALAKRFPKLNGGFNVRIGNFDMFVETSEKVIGSHYAKAVPDLVGLKPGRHHTVNFRSGVLKERQAKPHVDLAKEFVFEPQEDFAVRASFKQAFKFVRDLLAIFDRVAVAMKLDKIRSPVPQILESLTGHVAINKAFAADDHFAPKPRRSEDLGYSVTGKNVDHHNERLIA